MIALYDLVARRFFGEDGMFRFATLVSKRNTL